MPLITNLSLAIDGGATINIHGATGQIHLTTGQVERFRRPAGLGAGYQVMGADTRPSELEFWNAFSSVATAKSFIDSLNALKPSPSNAKAVKVTYKEYTALRCIVMDVEIKKSIACRGSIITGSTAATWRVEGVITLEYAP